MSTPRTDAFCDGGINTDTSSYGVRTWYEHARQLETELQAANRQIEMDSVRFKEMQDAGYALEVKLDAAEKCVEALRELRVWYSVGGLCEPMDTASKALAAYDAVKGAK